MKASIRKLALSALLLLQFSSYGQSVLDQYIRQAIDSNLALQQKRVDITKAKLDLERAKAWFFPQVNLNAQYTLANGGRTQDLPIGDLMNPVYKTLNQLTGSSAFPQISNQTIQFLPNDFHETRVEVNYAVFNKDRQHTQRIQAGMIGVQEAETAIYKRELVKQVKQAYYQYLQTLEAAKIYQNAQELVAEQLRFSEKLVKNQVATREIVLQAKAQLSQLQASIEDNQQQQKNTAAWFNFLLNRGFDIPIQVNTTEWKNQSPQSLAVETQGREELRKLDQAKKVLEANKQMQTDFYLPKLNAFYQTGFQGFGYKFDDKQFYQLAGLQLQWSIFRGNENKVKIKQANAALTSMQLQENEVQQQLKLQSTTAWNSYQSAKASLASITDELNSAQEVYRLAEKRWKEGNALQIELIQARTQLTNAAIRQTLVQLNLLNKAAELERANATYSIN
ncbi:MAG: TolC family protein [Chitinophagaceae bacterium]